MYSYVYNQFHNQGQLGIFKYLYTLRLMTCIKERITNPFFKLTGFISMIMKKFLIRCLFLDLNLP